MLFSVIIPVYNAKASIKRCLDSLKNQVFADYEVIIVDDGSTDNSGAICEAYSVEDNRIHYYRKPNGGPSSARNAGLDIAKGEYIVFLDSDDCYSETYLQSFFHLINSYQKCGHFWCGYRTISENSVDSGKEILSSRQSEVEEYHRTELMTLHDKMILAPLWNKAYSRRVIQQYCLRMKKDLSLGEDLLFNLEYLDKCSNTSIIVWNYPEYYYYNTSQDSLNHRYRSDLDEIYKLIRGSMYSCLEKWNASEDQFVRYYTMVFYMLQQVAHNYNKRECALTRCERWHKIKTVFDGEEYRIALRQGMITIHPVLKAAYRTKNWLLIQTVEKLSEWKKTIEKHFMHLL